MRKKRSTITVKMVQGFIDLYQNKKLNAGIIAEKYNVAPSTVLRYLQENGVKTTRNVKHRRRKFYKNQFLICLYDMEDNLVGVFDNVHELSTYTKKPVNSLNCMLNPNKLHKKMRINGKWYRKELIEVI